eukprot:TRINITY_DN10504_c0_g1_i2.p1 TRINITY_DN10504_c0_g1~~TRINITY_DN10504_c0_g1_i2.p1  ORF type:complete len:320 (+),score=41.39 TRINITY_DN10504_c0_g1_i2:68-1027(+)
MAASSIFNMLACWVPLPWTSPEYPESYDYGNMVMCKIQGFMVTASGLSCWVWPSLFAVGLYITNKFEFDLGRRWFLLCHLLGWMVPLVISFVCGVFDVYGHTHLWCWVDNDLPQVQIALCAVIILMFVIELSVLMSLLISMRRSGIRGFGFLYQQKRALNVRMCAFLIIPPLCWCWAIIDRAWKVFFHDQIYWLYIMHAVMSCSLGLCNALAYSGDKELLQLWVEKLSCSTRQSRQSLSHKSRQLIDPTLALLSPGSATYKQLTKAMHVNVDVNSLYQMSEDDHDHERDNEGDHHEKRAGYMHHHHHGINYETTSDDIL